MAVGIDDLPDSVLQLIAQYVTWFPQRCALPAFRALQTHGGSCSSPAEPGLCRTYHNMPMRQ